MFIFPVRNSVFLGRVPLILHCKHNLCEECIRQKLRSDALYCPECKEIFAVDSNTNLQEEFPVNFYLLGMMYYAKPNSAVDPKYCFRPAGSSLRGCSKFTTSQSSNCFGQGFVATSVDRGNGKMTFSRIIYVFFNFIDLEHCSKQDCTKPAQLHCTDCAEVYCATCCDTIHKMARGFRLHKITPINFVQVKHLKEPCVEHLNAVLEFHCNNCNADVCCYCLIKNHSGHDFYPLSELVSRIHIYRVVNLVFLSAM